MTSHSLISVLIVAAGAGLRAGGGLPKQYRLLGGKPLLAHTLAVFAGIDAISDIVPVIGDGQDEAFARVLAAVPAALRGRIRPAVLGGATRQESVRRGLEALSDRAPTHVLIHDGARAFTSRAHILDILNALHANPAVIPGLQVQDTVKRVDKRNLVQATVAREPLRLVQTPQGFEFDLILDAHRRAKMQSVSGLTDDAALAEWAGIPVRLVEGDPANRKITTSEDFDHAEKQLMQSCSDIRVGQGYDVHALVEGDHVWLGGVRIPHTARLSGHSDADVLIHALVDAILGALGDGDIGVHFPPSDNQWRGAPSRVFLEFARARVAARGGIIAHLDGTLVCEGPKIGPYREEIRAKIAEITGIALDRVGLKATTSEKLGFLGRAEGIAAFATATIRLP